MVCPVCWGLAAVGAASAVLKYAEGRLGERIVLAGTAALGGALSAAAIKKILGYSLCGGNLTFLRGTLIVGGSFLIAAITWKAVQILLNLDLQKIKDTSREEVIHAAKVWALRWVPFFPWTNLLLLKALLIPCPIHAVKKRNRRSLVDGGEPACRHLF